jgi:hypothetical protein
MKLNYKIIGEVSGRECYRCIYWGGEQDGCKVFPDVFIHRHMIVCKAFRDNESQGPLLKWPECVACAHFSDRLCGKCHDPSVYHAPGVFACPLWKRIEQKEVEDE